MIQRFTDWRGDEWFRLTSTSATAGHSVIRLDPAAFPDGCIIEWFSLERNALRVCTNNDESAELPFCGALKSQNMRIVQRGEFPPDWLSRGINLGVYSCPCAGVFFRIRPAHVTSYHAFYPATAYGSVLWQIGMWTSSLWIIACLISLYCHSGHKRFALLALVYSFLLGFMYFERPFDGMAGNIDHDDDSYYVAYTQNLMNHKSMFSAPTELMVGRPVINHNHGLPGTALFLAPAAWLSNVWEHRPFTYPIDLAALRGMRLASATYSLLATILLFLAAHQIAVSGWNIPVAAFLIWGTSLSKWTYQRNIFSHSIELMLLCGIILFAIYVNKRDVISCWIGILTGLLLGGLCLVRGEYLLAIPIVPCFFTGRVRQTIRDRLTFWGSYFLTLTPFVLFYRYAVGQLSTGYGSLASSTNAPHNLHGLCNMDFWQKLGQNILVLLQNYWESGATLFCGAAALIALSFQKKNFVLPKYAAGIFMLTFLLATALFPLPLGSEWQHRYSLKLYPFALLAILAWRANTPYIRSANYALASVFLFSMIQQLTSFELYQREGSLAGTDTAKWILSDAQLLTQGLSDPHYTPLHWSIIIISIFWIVLVWHYWRQTNHFKWRYIAMIAAGILTVCVLIWRTPFWMDQDGLIVTYFRDSDCKQPVCHRFETNISKDYGFRSPAFGVGHRHYSSRWQGLLIVPESGTYTFFAESSGGVRIRLGDLLLINNWENIDWRGSGRKVTLPLNAGTYPFIVEHCARNGQGALRLRWDGGHIPDGSVIGAPYLKRIFQ